MSIKLDEHDEPSNLEVPHIQADVTAWTTPISNRSELYCKVEMSCSFGGMILVVQSHMTSYSQNCAECPSYKPFETVIFVGTFSETNVGWSHPGILQRWSSGDSAWGIWTGRASLRNSKSIWTSGTTRHPAPGMRGWGNNGKSTGNPLRISGIHRYRHILQAVLHIDESLDGGYWIYDNMWTIDDMGSIESWRIDGVLNMN